MILKYEIYLYFNYILIVIAFSLHSKCMLCKKGLIYIYIFNSRDRV